MNRLEFMKKLEMLLFDVSQSEKEEAMKYYNDYLNDAGVENEQEVLDSLGSPEKVAKMIREGIIDNGQTGEFTETGYKNYTVEEDKQEVLDKSKHKKMSGGMIALIIFLAILAAPLLLSIAGGIFGAGFGILTGIFGLIVGIAAAGIALFIAGFVLIGVGIGYLFTIPLAGICVIGAGLLILGLSLFFIWLTVWFCGKAVPAIIRTVVDLFGRLFHKKGGENS